MTLPLGSTIAITRAALLGLLVLASSPGHAQITIPSGTGDQMLAGMMSMMGEFANQFQNAQGGGLSGGFGSLPMNAAQQAYNPMSGGMMGAPMSGLGQEMGQGMGQGMAQGFGQQAGRGISQQLAKAGGAAFGAMGSTNLDGAWRGQNGEILLIEGKRFRLHADRRRYLDGRLGRRGNIVGFLYPKRQTALLYRYQISGNRLALQSRDRSIRYFQRLPIER